MSSICIETKRLVLNLLGIADITLLQTYMNDDVTLAESFSFWGEYRHPILGAHRVVHRLIETEHGNGEGLTLAIRWPDEPANFIGIVRFEQFDADQGIWQRSYWLESQHRRFGLMREASLAATSWMFTQKRAMRIDSCIAENNARSRAICEHQGFRQTCYLPQGLPVWSITAEEFQVMHA